MAITDEMSGSYLTTKKLHRIFKIVDFWGYLLFSKRRLQHPLGKKLLFINFGVIGDLIIFRYVVEEFVKLDYEIDILILDEVKFLFEDLNNIGIITVKGYREKKIFSGCWKIYQALRKNKKQYDLACHFRPYLGTAIFTTYLSGKASQAIGYGTSGFGFLLNKKLKWKTNTHESIHFMDILQVIDNNYDTVNIKAYDYLLSENKGQVLLDKFNLKAGEYIVIHSTSKDKRKNIPHALLNYCMSYLLQHGKYKVVIVGTRDELAYIPQKFNSSCDSSVVYTNGKINFLEIRQLVAEAKCFIGIDSSIAHLISSLDLPKVIVWHGINLFAQWKPLGLNYHFIYNSSLSCVSCFVGCDELQCMRFKESVLIDKLQQLGVVT